MKHTFIDKNMEKYKNNETVRKLVAEFEDRGKESSTIDSGGIFCFGKVVAEEQVVCSPLKEGDYLVSLMMLFLFHLMA